jgi:hypothetical protein
MANHISYDARADVPIISMSNARTFLFMQALSLATSALAREDSEREFAVWFAARDQAVFGAGTVGFDVSEMPWRPESFTADRDFVIRAIDRAKVGVDWKKYGWQVGALDAPFESFGAMVASFALADAAPDPDRPNHFRLCERHAVYQHAYGCPLCNDQWK